MAWSCSSLSRNFSSSSLTSSVILRCWWWKAMEPPWLLLFLAVICCDMLGFMDAHGIINYMDVNLPQQHATAVRVVRKYERNAAKSQARFSLTFWARIRTWLVIIGLFHLRMALHGYLAIIWASGYLLLGLRHLLLGISRKKVLLKEHLVVQDRWGTSPAFLPAAHGLPESLVLPTAGVVMKPVSPHEFV